MNESKIAGIIILVLLACMPLGFIIFGSRFTPIAPLIIVVGICIFGYISMRKRKQRTADMINMRDELLKKRWKDEHS
jgi:hypothetical protein